MGQRLLPTAHAAGVRHLAMEALYPEFATEANDRRIVPNSTMGYLAQPEMRDLIGAALELGWTLVPYEADHNSRPPDLARLSMEDTNWREDEQARNLADALSELEDDTKLLVWCGNSHNAKTALNEWVPMGLRFSERAGFQAFAIDQTRGVQFDGEWTELSYWHRVFAREIGAGAGFLAEERPQDWPDFGVDAFILSTDNDLT